MLGRVLIVAGSDSGGGAGIQADIKTVTVLGGYAATAITALTAQNTDEVRDILAVPPEFILAQMRAVLEDIGADCIKTGMLLSAPVIDALANFLGARATDIPLVVDPVMVATSGGRLMEEAAIEALKTRLAPKATVFTPNIPEAERLTAMKISSVDDMREAARKLLALGPGAVLLKGGHLPGDQVTDVLVTAEICREFEGERIVTRHTHGTGCTLASAIATGLAQGLPLAEAVPRARELVRRALAAAPQIGHGAGPINQAAWFG